MPKFGQFFYNHTIKSFYNQGLLQQMYLSQTDFSMTNIHVLDVMVIADK